MDISLASRAALVLPLALAAGCVSPLAIEREAFDRWQQRDDRARATAPDHHAAFVAAAALPAEPTLDNYLAHAMTHHPGLAAAFHEWRAALERVPQARAWADPQLSYTAFVRRSMNRQTASLSQAFPWYGRLRARSEVAMAEARAAEQTFEQQRSAVVAAVKQAYADYALLGRSLDVLRESQRILEDVAASAATRYTAGEVAYADRVRAEVAVEQARDELLSLEAQRDPLVAQLNVAIGRPSHHDLPLPGQLPQPTLDADEPTLLAWLAESNPALQALAYETTGRRHGLRLARQNRIPDLMLGVEYMDMLEMGDQVGLMASISLPLWPERTRAERREALAAFGAATHARTQRRHELEAELRLAYARFRDADRRLSLYEQTLIPLAREALEAAEASYAAGESAFDAITQTQVALQEAQLIFQRVSVDRYQRLTEIERLVGRSVGDQQPAAFDDQPQQTR